jgi:hypothetical protein
MSMPTATAQLTKATKAMLYHWEIANEHWNDPVSKRIEEKHIDPLLQAIRAAVGAMDSMGETIAKSQSECS